MFTKSSKNCEFFQSFQKYFEIVVANQNVLLLKDQGAFAAAVEAVQPKMRTLSPVYNYLDKWKDVYAAIDKPIKVMHCTYPYRPQYAKNITRSLFTRIVDRTAKIFLPNQINNPWRLK